MTHWWKLPVWGAAVFFVLSLLAGHLWTTALLRTVVCAAVLAVAALAGAWGWRWMAEGRPSTIDLRSAPGEEDVRWIAFQVPPADGEGAVISEKSRGEESRGQKGSEEESGPLRGDHPPSQPAADSEWIDLAAWTQRRR
ncbi:MAG: hypothetical protein QJR06_01475 [Alicyclobacillaceae bacterium]|nr:hypothetical protein [Alicyclobacillaceae bacterium]